MILLSIADVGPGGVGYLDRLPQTPRLHCMRCANQCYTFHGVCRSNPHILTSTIPRFYIRRLGSDHVGQPGQDISCKVPDWTDYYLLNEIPVWISDINRPQSTTGSSSFNNRLTLQDLNAL
jgi:hypothetical protein